MTTHNTCLRILYCSVYPQLPPVIGAPWGCCGHASGIYSPRPLWFGGCITHATPCSVPGYSYFRMCLEKSERNCLTSYLYDAAILASFFLFACLKACFRLSLSTRNKKKRTVTSKKYAYRPETSYCVYYSLKGIKSGSPMVVTYGQQYHVGEKPTVVLYTYINRHAGTPSKTETADTMSLDRAQFFTLGLFSNGCQHFYITIL